MKTAGTRVTFISTGNPTGLKFTVEYGERRALFDFGLEHAPGRAPFSAGLEPRAGRELEDLLAVGMAPRLGGVYRRDGWDGRTALFVSHLHLDHTGLVRFVDPELPVFFPEAMEPVRAAAVEAGVVGWRAGAPGNPVAAGGRVRWGEIEVELVEVDHDVPGATGFLVRTPDLRIAYTGDHRWHGLRPGLTRAFAERAAGCDVLVQECVGLGGAAGFVERAEAEVHEGFDRLLGDVRGLVAVNLYPMNRERVAAFAEACRRRGRRLAGSAGAAAVAGVEMAVVDVDAVRADPGGHCVVLDFEELPSLIDLEPRGGVYVHSNGAPLGAFDPAYGVMAAWPAALGMEFVSLGSSGHAPAAQVPRMAELVRPRVVMPVHTRAPELYPALEGVRVLPPEPGRAYDPADFT